MMILNFTSPGDLRRLGITQTPIENHQLILVWKTLKGVMLIISECSKLAQKEYKTKHDWVGKMIHWELSNKL